MRKLIYSNEKEIKKRYVGERLVWSADDGLIRITSTMTYSSGLDEDDLSINGTPPLLAIGSTALKEVYLDNKKQTIASDNFNRVTENRSSLYIEFNKTLGRLGISSGMSVGESVTCVYEVTSDLIYFKTKLAASASSSTTSLRLSESVPKFKRADVKCIIVDKIPIGLSNVEHDFWFEIGGTIVSLREQLGSLGLNKSYPSGTEVIFVKK